VLGRGAVVLALCGLASNVAAQPAREAQVAGDREAAQAAFRVGAQAFRANLFAVAARSFEQAYERDARPETAFSIAQANRLQYYVDRIPWRIQRAVQLYQAYLEKLPAGPRARDAIDRLGELEPLLAELRQRGELKPYVAPARTQLVVGAEVDQAALTIDGRTAALWEPVDVAAGSHDVVVTARGYEVARKRVVIGEGRFLPVDVALEAKPARIRVRSEAGARLLVDGRDAGAVPAAIATVPAGEHVVAITRRGRSPWSRSVVVARDQQLVLDAELAPTAQRRIAWWVLGTAASLAVSSGAVALWAYDARRDAEAIDRARRNLTATPADLARYNERVGQEARRNDVALGLGISALAVGLLGAGMWWFDHEVPRAVPLGVEVGAGRGALTLTTTF
jgi:hypothetical protein